MQIDGNNAWWGNAQWDALDGSLKKIFNNMNDPNGPYSHISTRYQLDTYESIYNQAYAFMKHNTNTGQGGIAIFNFATDQNADMWVEVDLQAKLPASSYDGSNGGWLWDLNTEQPVDVDSTGKLYVQVPAQGYVLLAGLELPIVSTTDSHYNCWKDQGTDWVDDHASYVEMPLAQCFMECAVVSECHSVTVSWSSDPGMVNCYLRGYISTQDCVYSNDWQYSTFSMSPFPQYSVVRKTSCIAALASYVFPNQLT